MKKQLLKLGLLLFMGITTSAALSSCGGGHEADSHEATEAHEGDEGKCEAGKCGEGKCGEH